MKQISICLDDFKHEKKDREQSQKETADLKKQLKKAEDFASSLKVQVTIFPLLFCHLDSQQTFGTLNDFADKDIEKMVFRGRIATPINGEKLYLFL